jgi:lipid-A-disaccharide synthase
MIVARDSASAPGARWCARGPGDLVSGRRGGAARVEGAPGSGAGVVVAPVVEDAASSARPGAPKRAPRILLVAGEASGDLHAADLITALRRAVPTLEVVGLGGDRLRAVGMRTIADARDVATVGLVEGLGRLRTLARIYRSLAGILRRERPDLAIFVDFPEFNLRLARIAKRVGVPVFYYIGPQVWAWRRGRIRTIARRVDALAVVFPFEPPLYSSERLGVEFVGHPLLDRVRATRSRAETRARYGLDPERVTVALLPGSRHKEIRYMLPRLLGAAAILGRERGCQFVLALAPTISRQDVESFLARDRLAVSVVADDTYNVIHAADLVLVTSGTATLETALLERPMVIAYRLSALSYAVARLLVGVPFIGIPNIVAGREIVPELVQRGATGPRIAAAARAILDDPGRQAGMVREFAAVRRRLGPGGAAERAAAIARRLLGAAGQGEQEECAP